jgi:hypothetical protein
MSKRLPAVDARTTTGDVEGYEEEMPRFALPLA